MIRCWTAGVGSLKGLLTDEPQVWRQPARVVAQPRPLVGTHNITNPNTDHKQDHSKWQWCTGLFFPGSINEVLIAKWQPQFFKKLYFLFKIAFFLNSRRCTCHLAYIISVTLNKLSMLFHCNYKHDLLIRLINTVLKLLRLLSSLLHWLLSQSLTFVFLLVPFWCTWEWLHSVH